MFARFIRAVCFPDIAYLRKPVAERKPPVMEKIYCGSCDWLISATSGYSCKHESNKVWTTPKNTWYSPDKDYSLREPPQQKNRRNDCPNHSRKIG